MSVNNALHVSNVVTKAKQSLYQNRALETPEQQKNNAKQ